MNRLACDSEIGTSISYLRLIACESLEQMFHTALTRSGNPAFGLRMSANEV